MRKSAVEGQMRAAAAEYLEPGEAARVCANPNAGLRDPVGTRSASSPPNTTIA
jgi:hypothetical protein